MVPEACCELLHRCARHRAESDWNELIERYGRRLEARVRRTLRRCRLASDDEQTGEMLQEVFCHLLDAGGRRLLACRGRSEGEVAAYLCHLTSRVVVDRVRQRQAAKRGGRRHRATTPLPALAERLVDPGAGPEERALARDGLRSLLARLRGLEEGARGARNLRVLLLAVVAGWTSREIAAAVDGLGPSGVDSLLARLKERLRRGWPQPVAG